MEIKPTPGALQLPRCFLMADFADVRAASLAVPLEIVLFPQFQRIEQRRRHFALALDAGYVVHVPAMGALVR